MCFWWNFRSPLLNGFKRKVHLSDQSKLFLMHSEFSILITKVLSIIDQKIAGCDFPCDGKENDED